MKEKSRLSKSKNQSFQKESQFWFLKLNSTPNMIPQASDPPLLHSFRAMLH